MPEFAPDTTVPLRSVPDPPISPDDAPSPPHPDHDGQDGALP